MQVGSPRTDQTAASAITLGALDDHTGGLPHEGALVVVCASCTTVIRWTMLSGFAAGSPILQRHLTPELGLAFSVFGCGNMDWASTYQAVPTLIDTQLEAHGVHRVHARGEGDARSDFDGQFSEWYSGLWSSPPRARHCSPSPPR